VDTVLVSIPGNSDLKRT